MKRALTKFFMWFADNPPCEPLIIPAAAADWRPANAEQLNAFLASPTGKILSERLRFIVATNAVNGARNTVNTIHAAGVSAGWDEAVRYLHSLSRVSRVLDTKTTDETPRGETELLEQLSP